MIKNRLLHLTLLGKSNLDLLEDIEKVKNHLTSSYSKENIIQFGNSFFISFGDDVIELSNNLKKHLKDSIAFIIFDVTDNLNIFDFVGYINEGHKDAKKFVSFIQYFTDTDTNFENETKENISDEELLKMAVENEDYEEAAKIRDRMSLKPQEN